MIETTTVVETAWFWFLWRFFVALVLFAVVVAGAERILELWKKPQDVDEDAPAIRNFRAKQPVDGNRRTW